jgi:hypothetical protein
MDTLSAFARGEANRGKDLMVFDWVKAAKMIKEHGVKDAYAGLQSDWEYTGGIILDCGKIPTESCTYLASTWAIPEIEIDGEKYDCYIMQPDRPDWDSGTFWPDEAKKIMGFI